ncbi:MAG: hypothetical protein PVI42_17910 [Desulfobacterales bacterium]|jgi:hypothetical protein
MHGYYWGYGVYPLFIDNFSGISPQPEPPRIVAMATPQPNPPNAPGIMLAVSNRSWALATPMPEPPNMVIFLGPQPEPPDKAFKRYKDYLAEIKAQAGRDEKSVEEAFPSVMLAVPNPSWAMGTPMPIPPSMPIFLSPQPEPPDKAFKRYKDYLAELKNWTGLYTKCLEEALSLVEGLEQELEGL